MSTAYPWLEPPWPEELLPRDQLQDRIEQLLASTNICVMATINKAGLPVASPIEYWMDGLDLYCLPDPGTPKLAAMQRDPHISLAVHGQYHGWHSGHGLQYFAKVEIIEPHAPGWDHGMKIFQWRPWMEDIGLDASKPFERQIAKITPYKILYTNTWLWKQGYKAKQVWEAD
jgi:hypothetical protein